ncbi:hypothetical protein B296_00053926 [Ensete ventricosum]|uniref:Uncharacterized protein n=1 Tax=Ensete ventricosum TaxID=4639 RepID=A0A426XEU5_ENSVE|nr:hypothetical protein B296_00053926 [Ensete ventricosum]
MRLETVRGPRDKPLTRHAVGSVLEQLTEMGGHGQLYANETGGNRPSAPSKPRDTFLTRSPSTLYKIPPLFFVLPLPLLSLPSSASSSSSGFEHLL